MLEFCELCNNLLYIRIFSNKYEKLCKNCNKSIFETNISKKISEINYTDNELLYKRYHAEYNIKKLDNGKEIKIPINKLLINDPTLIRIVDHNLKAPNGYEHKSGDAVCYLKQIDQTSIWISTKTGEIWRNQDIKK
jgi:DNA-directed RNA polymerase subunit M/transcription elongation factor TFIIS